jgi:DNA-binding winged helix-turn-helix (wHTH) protein
MEIRMDAQSTFEWRHAEVYEFGGFRLEVAERRLTQGTQRVHLAPKTYDVLVVLVQHPGHLVTKGELLGRVWPNIAVEEGILTVHISGLRKILGDITRSPLYIETVSRSGYRFIAAVTRLNDLDVPLSARRSFPAFAGARS